MNAPLLRGLAIALAAAGGALLFTMPGTAAAPATPKPHVLAVEFDNDVNPVTQDYLIGEMRRAERERFDAVVILMDTPGGLSSSMRKIVKELLDLKIPGLV